MAIFRKMSSIFNRDWVFWPGSKEPAQRHSHFKLGQWSSASSIFLFDTAKFSGYKLLSDQSSPNPTISPLPKPPIAQDAILSTVFPDYSSQTPALRVPGLHEALALRMPTHLLEAPGVHLRCRCFFPLEALQCYSNTAPKPALPHCGRQSSLHLPPPGWLLHPRTAGSLRPGPPLQSHLGFPESSETLTGRWVCRCPRWT